MRENDVLYPDPQLNLLNDGDLGFEKQQDLTKIHAVWPCQDCLQYNVTGKPSVAFFLPHFKQ